MDGGAAEAARTDGAWDSDQLSPIFIFCPSKSAAPTVPTCWDGGEEVLGLERGSAGDVAKQHKIAAPKFLRIVGVANIKHGMVVECFDNDLSCR